MAVIKAIQVMPTENYAEKTRLKHLFFVKAELVKKKNPRGKFAMNCTSMEGSFGTQKEHYGLHRVKVRLKETETFMIFFGVHTGNVVILGRRLLAKEVSEEAEDLKTVG